MEEITDILTYRIKLKEKKAYTEGLALKIRLDQVIMDVLKDQVEGTHLTLNRKLT